MSAIHWGHGKTEARGGYTAARNVSTRNRVSSQTETNKLPKVEFSGHAAKIIGGVTLGILAGITLDAAFATAFPHLMSTYANLYSFDMQHGAPLSFIGGAELSPLVPVALGGFVGGKVAAR